MCSIKTRKVLLALCLILFCGQAAHASNRWDVLKWCTATTPADNARCEGFLSAAIDVTTSDDFPGPKSCFHPNTRLPHVRNEVVAWLKENKIAPEQSGLALVSRAIKERFPCVE